MTSPSSEPPDPLQRLAGALAAGEPEADIACLALLAAACHYPDLDIGAYLGRMDALAARAQARLGEANTPARVIAALNAVLFEEEGYAGNVEDYYDPRNSYLNEVMDRRTGIPITLSILYIAVAQRLGQPIEGVALPLHFIVKYVGQEGDIYIDPFHRGKILTVTDCQAQVERSYGAPIHFQPSYLDAVPARAILYRMLNNLKFNYLRLQDYEQAGHVIEQMLILQPDQPEEVRDRGLLYYQERRWAQAVEYLARYLRDNPDAADTDMVRARLESAWNFRARRN